MGQVMTSKFSTIFFSGRNVCIRCIQLIVETSKVFCDSIYSYVASPLFKVLCPVNPLESTSEARGFFPVPSILTICCFSQIGPSIVKSISVFVVTAFVGVHFHLGCDLNVHVNTSSLMSSRFVSEVNAPHGISLNTSVKARFILMRLPTPLHQPVVITGVNNSELSLSKRNPARTFFHVGSLASRFCLADEPACLPSLN